MIARTCKCGNVGLSCWICDWQTSTLQPSQGITTQILNFLSGIAILYMKNDFQSHRTSVEIVSIEESQAVIEDSARHTACFAVLYRVIACFILVQSVHKTYEKAFFMRGSCWHLFRPFLTSVWPLTYKSQFPQYPLYRTYRILGIIHRYTGYIFVKYTTAVDKPTHDESMHY
jgi:hypothetical protein